MPLQTSGAISMSNIQSEFGGSNPISITEYLRGGAAFLPLLVPDTPANSNIPTTANYQTDGISLGDFYGGDSAPAGPPDPVRGPLESFGYSGGLGTVTYEIVTGIKFTNPGNPDVAGFNDQRASIQGWNGRHPLTGHQKNMGSSTGNLVYTIAPNIMQAQPGDTISIEAHGVTSGNYAEYFEFWKYNVGSSGWTRWTYSDRVTISPGLTGVTRSATLEIPDNLKADNYAIAVAMSYSTLGATSYRSWRSYALHIY